MNVARASDRVFRAAVWSAAALSLAVLHPGAATCAAAAMIDVSTARDSGKGSLRAAIEAANRSPGSTIRIRLGAGTEIAVERALPALVAQGVRLDGGGVTLREDRDCRRAGGQRGCDGIVVEARDVVVHDLRIVGFMFDGIAVRGAKAREVRIERVESIDNLDDGVGVSEGAGPVLIEHCLLMGNGFRTKGKGLLVFDRATATLRDSVVVGNRDGVTVTRDSSAVLERVLIAGNYDKGVGVSAARVSARGCSILANGYADDAAGESPNGDGVRVGLGGEAEISRCRIAGSGDSGVVVLDTSRVELEESIVEANRGVQTSVAPGARLVRR